MQDPNHKPLTHMGKNHGKGDQQLETGTDEAQLPRRLLGGHEDAVDAVNLHQQWRVDQREADVERGVGDETRHWRRLQQEDGHGQTGKRVTAQHHRAQLPARGFDQAARAAPDVESRAREDQSQHEEVESQEWRPKGRSEGQEGCGDGLALCPRGRVRPCKVTVWGEGGVLGEYNDKIQTHKRFKRTQFIKIKNTTYEFVGQSPLLSYKMTLKNS